MWFKSCPCTFNWHSSLHARRKSIESLVRVSAELSQRLDQLQKEMFEGKDPHRCRRGLRNVDGGDQKCKLSISGPQCHNLARMFWERACQAGLRDFPGDATPAPDGSDQATPIHNGVDGERIVVVSLVVLTHMQTRGQTIMLLLCC